MTIYIIIMNINIEIKTREKNITSLIRECIYYIDKNDYVF